MRSAHVANGCRWDPMSGILGRIRQELIHMGIERDKLASVLSDVDERNRRDLAAWSALIVGYMLVCLLLSLSSAAFAACRPVYVGALVACSLTFAYAKILWKKFPGHIPKAVALFDLAVLALGLGISFFQPESRSVTMVAIAIIIPTCFIVPTIANIAFQALSIVVFAICGGTVLSPDVYSFGLLTLVMFSSLGTIMGHRINKARFERFVYADSTQRLADMQMRYAYYDSLTGLLNRRAYNEEIGRLREDTPADAHIVIADVNGLKEMNDVHGHEAGDALLVGVAHALTDAFGCDAKVYRLGGDEFCTIATGSGDDIGGKLARLREALAAGDDRVPGVMSVSFGVGDVAASGGVDEAVRGADRAMYEQKREYYEQAGVDRRRRRG